jgi:hypothetical protein
MHRKREEIDPLRQAAYWRSQASVLRRRAAREGVDDDVKAEASTRAAWYERRADLVDAAYPAPPIFPRELRTPVDGLDLVDDLRRAADDLVAIALAVDDAEIVAFAEAVRRARGPVLQAARAVTMTRHASNIARELSQALGVSLRLHADDAVTFEDYAIEIVEGDELDNPPEDLGEAGGIP